MKNTIINNINRHGEEYGTKILNALGYNADCINIFIREKGLLIEYENLGNKKEYIKFFPWEEVLLLENKIKEVM